MASHQFEQNLTDRKLGHEWYGWDGDIDAHEGFIREPKRLVLTVALAGWAGLMAALGVALWAVAPRLEQLHPSIPSVAWAMWVAVSVLGLVALAVVACAVLLGRPLAPAERLVHAMFRHFIWLERVARLAGMSKDRLGYSLVALHNALAAHRRRIMANGRILCLAPRCIERGNLEEIRALVAQYDCDFYVAPNGALARQKIVQLKPAAIIGIACERDLVTGIRDVGYRLPVIGIANKRPLGPCKGAFIDLEELREAILTFRRQLGAERASRPRPATASEPEPVSP